MLFKSMAWVAMALTLASPLSLQAETYPSRPIRVIVAYAPGGGADILARLLAPGMTKSLGQSVVIENRAGGGGSIGSEACARAPADGYTLCLGSTTTHGIIPFLYKSVRYDAQTDFEPISLVITQSNVLAVHPGAPVNNLKEFLSWAAKGDGVSYATAGVGTSNHLVGIYLNTKLGLKLNHIAYKSGGQALMDVLAGRVPVTIDQISTLLPYIKEGKLRPIAVTSPRRAEALSDVPTLVETVLPDANFHSYQGVFAPAGTPPAVVDRLYRSIREAVADPDTTRKLKELGAEIVVSTPADFKAQIRREAGLWKGLVDASGAKQE